MASAPIRPARTTRSAGATCGVLLLLASACGGADEEADRALRELEQLAFLGAREFSLPRGYTGEHASWTIDAPLLIDVFEVTRGRYAEVFGERGPQVGFTLQEAGWGGPDEADWPAFMTQHEAAELARRRGMRLPTAGEWLYAAIGHRAHEFPWGQTAQQSWANTLELNLGRPTPVGTFESGRSELGCYDMLGNVREWVSDWVPGEGDDLDSLPRRPAGGTAVSAMGGSYKFELQALYRLPTAVTLSHPIFLAHSLDPAFLSPDTGGRCIVEARTYLSGRADEWLGAPRARARLSAIGRRWAESSSQASELLEELSSASPGQKALAWLAEGARQP